MTVPEPPDVVVLVDNTVLCNFAAVRRMDLLEVALAGRGRVTEAVHDEMVASAALLPGLRAAVNAPWLGTPVEVVEGRANVQRLRRDIFGGVTRCSLQHLGEAESCHLLMTHPDFEGGWWASDDGDSLDYAQDEGITTRETMNLMAEAARAGAITPEQGIDLMRRMIDENRHPRQPVSVAELMRVRSW